jgi:hypothetical protein
VETPADVCAVEAIEQLHGIASRLFVPFTIARLRGDSSTGESMLTVRLRGMETKENLRTLRLTWSVESVLTGSFGVQEHIVTEWAAMGVACIVVWQYAGLHIRAVATPGERFDFWVTDGMRQWALEVSGTMTEAVEKRHQEKVNQLRENPYGVDGYVVVVAFSTREVIFSFNRFTEENS